MRLRSASSECVFGVRLRSASSECVFGVRLRSASSECVFGVRLRSASSECVFGVRLRSASSECVFGVRLRSASSTLFVCLFVGLFHIGNWNFWLVRPSSLGYRVYTYWCYVVLVICASSWCVGREYREKVYLN